MATRLQIYNDALILCGERALADLSENREPRRLLDEVWSGTGLGYCLEQKQWHFAIRTQQVDPDPSINPTFGYRLAFPKPDDWIATSAVCSDEYFRTPLTAYADEVGIWYADIEPIFVKFVSNDAQYGMNLGKWPSTFADYVAAYFAGRIITKLAGSKADQVAFLHGAQGQIETGHIHKTLMIAANKAAMTQPTQFVAQGSWTRARMGGRNYRRDRGNTGSLIG